LPDGLQFVRSDPPATIQGNQLTWTLGPLGPRQGHGLQLVCRATRVGPVTNCASVATVDGLRAEQCVTTQVIAPGLTLAMTGPPTGAVGAPISYQVTVTNTGSGPTTNIVLSDRFDPGLEHETRANPVELRIGSLGPNETRTVPIVLTPRLAGRLVNRVDATADGGLKAHAEHAVDVQAARIGLSNTGPATRYVERPAVFDIRVTNPGDIALSNVVVRDQLPPELGFTSATNGGQFAGGQVVWKLGALKPREERQVQV